MKSQAEKPVLKAIGREHVLFPNKVPPEVKTLVKASTSLEKSSFRKMIKLALGYIDHSLTEEECEIAFDKLCSLLNCNTEEKIVDLSIQYSGVITLLKSALRVNTSTVRQENFLSDLKSIGLPNDLAIDIGKVIYGPSRSDINDRIFSTIPHLSKLEKFDWRVNVNISSSWLSKVMEPVIIMKLKTSDGKLTEFEVPVSQFHQLRYTVANLMNKNHFHPSQSKKEMAKVS